MTEAKRLVPALRQAGIADPDAVLEHIEHYLALLGKWNARINLVGCRDPDELIDVHVADAIAVVAHVPAAARRLVDVGSGGGLPAVIIAAARPELEVTALEPVRKKQAFLAAARRQLPLPNFRPLAERDEQHRVRGDFEPYDAAVSRATFELPEWLARGARLVRPGGVVLGLEGAHRYSLPAGATRYPYELGDRTRAIVALPVGPADP